MQMVAQHQQLLHGRAWCLGATMLTQQVPALHTPAAVADRRQDLQVRCGRLHPVQKCIQARSELLTRKSCVFLHTLKRCLEPVAEDAESADCMAMRLPRRGKHNKLLCDAMTADWRLLKCKEDGDWG